MHLRTLSIESLITYLRRNKATGLAMLKNSIFAILLISFGLLPSHAFGEIRKAKKEVETNKNKQKFVLPCAAGTEQYGEFGTKMVCRQPLTKGKYRPEGQYVAWHANGKTKLEGEYARGNKHGVWTTYHRNGKKKWVETYYSGKRQTKTKFDRYGRPKDPPVDPQQQADASTDKAKKKTVSWRFMRK